MNIGIITFWNSEDNYGQILQSYALQRFLIKKGHDAFLIRYTPVNKKRNILGYITALYKALKLMLFNINELKLFLELTRIKKNRVQENRDHPRGFSIFKKKNIIYTSVVYDQYELYNTPPVADVYIAGSDQIWSGLDSCFYLQFVPVGKKCIAYAPSFGGKKYSEKSKKILKHYLDKFSVLTMREDDGVEICKSVGRNDVSLVPDPTLLLSLKDYTSISTVYDSEKDYLLLYLLGNKMDFNVAEVYTWAKNHQMEVKYVASQGRIDDYEKIYPNIDEWLGLIQNAKYVVTNSFHGSVFSIIMNKPFLSIPLIGGFSRMNSRIENLLSTFNLTNRIYKDSIDVLLLPIDYAVINDILSESIECISSDFDKWLE